MGELLTAAPVQRYFLIAYAYLRCEALTVERSSVVLAMYLVVIVGVKLTGLYKGARGLESGDAC